MGAWWIRTGHTATTNQAAREEIGRRISEARERLGLKTMDLAEAIGRHSSGVSDVERGKTALSLGALLQFAEALGVPPGSLLPGATANGSNEHYQRGYRHGYLHAVEIVRENVPE